MIDCIYSYSADVYDKYEKEKRQRSLRLKRHGYSQPTSTTTSTANSATTTSTTTATNTTSHSVQGNGAYSVSNDKMFNGLGNGANLGHSSFSTAAGGSVNGVYSSSSSSSNGSGSAGVVKNGKHKLAAGIYKHL